MKVIISGGGTGGHIFPAIAIADEICRIDKNAAILFVGAIGRMEMEKVPNAGYEIKGLPIAGLQRKLTLENLKLPFKILKSMRLAKRMLKEFQPDIAIGVGGYASGPLLKAAQRMGIPTLLQEQNSYAGVTNKLLAKKAKAICVAFDKMDRFFPKEKITLTGNPVREKIIQGCNKSNPWTVFDLDPSKKTVFLFGGSLGARTLNDVMQSNTELIKQLDEVQFIWQVGGRNFNNYKDCETAKLTNVTCLDFIKEMETAYRLADVIVCRAGALTISELCIVGKPAILVPSPYVAEDHQTKNAMSLVENNAAILVSDQSAPSTLMQALVQLLNDENKKDKMSKAIKGLAKPDAVNHIVDIITSVSNAE